MEEQKQPFALPGVLEEAPSDGSAAIRWIFVDSPHDSLYATVTPMSDMRQWLKSLGLGQYANAFEQNDVDAEVLAELNHELLQRIGVSSVGHRVKIIKAVASFLPQEIDSELRDAALSASQATSSPEPSREAERRQLTVMFCDLVDSVALGERMELDDYRELLARFRTATTQVGESFNGFIARHPGDGLLV